MDEISNVILKSDIESLGSFLREDFMDYHNNTLKIIKVYNSKKFVVKDKDLNEYRQSYYINIVEEKLNVILFRNFILNYKHCIII